MVSAITEGEKKPLKYPGAAPRIIVSAKTGEGIEAWRDWLSRVGAPVEARA